MSRFPGWDERAVTKLMINSKAEIAKVQHQEFLKKEKKRKYNNEIIFYNSNRYDSVGEADYARGLDFAIKGNAIKSWRRQIPFTLIVNGRTICKHIIDFEITHNDDSLELIEYKGFETEEWKIKRKLFNALYPDLKYRVVKHQKKSKKSKKIRS
jgi:hypothetical protein